LQFVAIALNYQVLERSHALVETVVNLRGYTSFLGAIEIAAAPMPREHAVSPV
jgi:hypothetical protein